MRRMVALLAAVALVAIAIFAIRTLRTQPALPPGAIADRIVIDKSERRLTLLRGAHPIKTYEVALGRQPIGHKQREGDGRTPQGIYKIDFHKRDSAFHRALHISYPNAADVMSAERRGVPPGGDIMIHGLPNGMGALGKLHVKRDWTEGCIAVTNSEIEEIWRAVPDGTVVEITP